MLSLATLGASITVQLGLFRGLGWHDVGQHQASENTLSSVPGVHTVPGSDEVAEAQLYSDGARDLFRSPHAEVASSSLRQPHGHTLGTLTSDERHRSLVKSLCKDGSVAVTILRVTGIFKKENKELKYFVFPHHEGRHFHEARKPRMETAAPTFGITEQHQ